MPSFPDHDGTLINTWQMGLLTPAENRLRWDAITRTYLFVLPLKAESTLGAGRYTLVATVILPNGDKLTDILTLTSK